MNPQVFSRTDLRGASAPHCATLDGACSCCSCTLHRKPLVNRVLRHRDLYSAPKNLRARAPTRTDAELARRMDGAPPPATPLRHHATRRLPASRRPTASRPRRTQTASPPAASIGMEGVGLMRVSRRIEQISFRNFGRGKFGLDHHRNTIGKRPKISPMG